MLHNLLYTFFLSSKSFRHIFYIYIGFNHYIFIFIHLFFLLLFIDAVPFMSLKCIWEIIYSVMYRGFIKHVFYG